jgi:hypothetical protein
MTLSRAGREPSQRLRTPQSRLILRAFGLLRLPAYLAALSVESSNDRLAVWADQPNRASAPCGANRRYLLATPSDYGK